MIFNPSFPYRFAHMLNAAYLTTGFVVLAVGARYLLAGPPYGRKAAPCCAWPIGLTAILAPLQLIIGDQHGLNTLEHQPVKVAAMEGHWDGTKPATSRSSPGRTKKRKPTASHCRSRTVPRSS